MTFDPSPRAAVAALGAAAPSVAQGPAGIATLAWSGKGDDIHADWPVAGGMAIRSQISRYRSVRSHSLQLMNYQEGAAR